MTDNTLGVFNNQVLADLYAELVSQGKLSETEALVVGATIEDLDIRDIQQMATRTSDPGTLGTYARLECGSRNHMRAFADGLQGGAPHTGTIE